MAAEELNSAKLNELYTKAETADRELFAEMKSNVLMVSGKHFQGSSKRLWNRIRDTKGDDQAKIRLVKNHISKITRTYVNEILSQAPGVRCLPHAETELQDQKAAELANSIWQDAKHRYRLNERIKDWVEDFVDLGECAVKILWDKNKGTLIGYEQEVDEEGFPLFTGVDGQPTREQMTPGQVDPFTGMQISQDMPHEPIKSDRPVFSGDFVFETILPFNLLRDPQAETMAEARYVIVRKMMSIEDAKALCGGDEEKERFVQESSETTFKVFDGQSGEFQDSKGQVLVREFFWRPCHKYPEGQYCLATESGILVDPMPLPFGIFPIVWAGFQKIQTTPRAHSVIRNLRPLQAEINRMASQAALHSISLGDDKLIIQAGSKVERGGELPGIRVLRVSGAPPTILPGRAGEQFLASLEKAVAEMYDIANLADMKLEMNGQMDPNTLLFRSMRHKRKFSLYATAFESFLVDLCGLYLKLAQKYLPEDTIIKKVGRREHVNIQEFKSLDDQSYAIKLESIGDDIETMLGKSLQIREVIQYLGKDLPKESIAQIVTAMPFLNGESMFGDLTMDVKNADSDILALDRGQYVPARKGENHEYLIKRLRTRMKMRDFELLPQEVQQMYEQKVQEHEKIKAEELTEIKRMQEGFIPMDGPLVGVDVFEEVPNSSGGVKTVRSRVPQNALNWLLEQMKVQGQQEQMMQGLPQDAQAGIADQFTQLLQQNQGQQSGVQGPQPMPQQGQGGMNGSQPDFSSRGVQFPNI